mmetsp:Transcript_11312/g.10951  ORF Transcript_11312/g.10951 Transcript_11312/m.10951 type:complete len:292 (+) Transcript_11312:83-958(+)
MTVFFINILFFIGMNKLLSLKMDPVIGFLGCGKISSALARGFAGADESCRPSKIIVSPRNEERSRKLFEDYGDIIEIASSNEDLVRRSDVVFIGLLPSTARELIPTLPFNDKQLIISMLATIKIGEVRSLVSQGELYKNTYDLKNIVRTVPLPSNSQRVGPILLHPSNTEVEAILSIVGKPIVCQTEDEMTPLVSLTGHISPFFELMRVTQDWAVKNGVDVSTARSYVSSFYSSLAASTDISNESFAELREEAATPGGLNEQSLKSLSGTEHFNLAEKSLEEIYMRLLGKG